MIELTREDLILWLENPYTKGFYEVLQKMRNDAEDAAFNATLDNYSKSGLTDRKTEELFAYRNLEVLNHFLIKTFMPMYEDKPRAEEILAKQDPEQEEEIVKDSLQDFINDIKELNDKN